MQYVEQELGILRGDRGIHAHGVSEDPLQLRGKHGGFPENRNAALACANSLHLSVFGHSQTGTFPRYGIPVHSRIARLFTQDSFERRLQPRGRASAEPFRAIGNNPQPECGCEIAQ